MLCSPPSYIKPFDLNKNNKNILVLTFTKRGCNTTHILQLAPEGENPCSDAQGGSS